MFGLKRVCCGDMPAPGVCTPCQQHHRDSNSSNSRLCRASNRYDLKFLTYVVRRFRNRESSSRGLTGMLVCALSPEPRKKNYAHQTATTPQALSRRCPH